MELNLPLYQSAGENAERIKSAQVKANTVSSNLCASIPSVSADDLELAMNGILASGTISSLSEASEEAGTPNPDPYQEDTEKNINSTGYALVNKNNCFAINSNYNNVEAVRMLYMCGMSLDDIRKNLSSLKPGDCLAQKFNRVRTRYSKTTYKEIIHNFSSARILPEYVSQIGDYTYVVSDIACSNTSEYYDGLYALTCEQDSTNLAYLECSPSFPVKGTLNIVIKDTEYSVALNATCGSSLEIQLADIPVDVYYSNGTLTFSSSSSFYFNTNDVMDSLGITEAMSTLKSLLNCGYSGAEYIDGVYFPYNLKIVVPSSSSANSRKIASSMKKSGVPDDICTSYLNGDSIYSNLTKLLDSVKNDFTSNFDNISYSSSSLYKATNIRVIPITTYSIQRILSLSDEDLEYLLRYRIDLLGIDPYVSQETAANGIVSAATTSSSGSTYTQGGDTPSWYSNTSSSRYIDTLVWQINKSSDENKKQTLKQTLGDYLNASSMITEETYTTEDTFNYSETSLGTTLFLGADYTTMLSLDDGLSMFENVSVLLESDQLNEFNTDMQVIQAYLDAAFSSFSIIQNRISSVIHKLNSSLSVASNKGTASLSISSVMQCSVSIDLGISIPPFLSFISLALVPIIEMLEALLDALSTFSNELLCPIQNLLDKYLNTDSFALPCRISYNVPVISGIENYLAKYKLSLECLKAQCMSINKDANWLKHQATLLPGSLSLKVTSSINCSES